MEIKDINKDHLENLIKIINSTWNYEKYGISKEDNINFSKLDLYDCLKRSNYFKVALVDGKPAGLLLGRDYTKPKTSDWDYLKTEEIRAENELKKSPNYPKLKDYERTYKEVNKDLKDGVDISFDSELVLFAVSPEYKRMGIGTELLNTYYKFLKVNDLHSLFVYTDTNCDYEFYTENGFKQLGKRLRNPKLRNYVDMEFYIFSKVLKS